MKSVVIHQGIRRIQGSKNELGYQGCFKIEIVGHSWCQVGYLNFKDGKLSGQSRMNDIVFLAKDNELISVVKNNKRYDLEKTSDCKFWSKELRKIYILYLDRFDIREENFLLNRFYVLRDNIWFNLVDGKISKGGNKYSLRLHGKSETYFFDIENDKILQVGMDPDQMYPVFNNFCFDLELKVSLIDYVLCITILKEGLEDNTLIVDLKSYE